MAIQDTSRYNIPKFWNDEFKHLHYTNEPFNDDPNIKKWLDVGFPNKFTGDMCDMRSPQPGWNELFIDFYTKRGWKDVGTSYYRMMPGTVLPTHGDLYVRYAELFNLKGQEHNIRRAVVFLEDWDSGHYSELCGEPIVQWHAGDVIEWAYDAPHMAANIGFTPRYTLQITGHL
jgi:hypothetical protein